MDSILYVGSGNFHPMGVQLSTTVPVIAADPFTGEARKVDIERIMRQRYAIMAKALDAKKWGVIVGMKPGQQRLELAKRIKQIAGDAGAHHHPRDHAGSAHLVQGGRLRLDGLPRVAIDDSSRFTVPVLTPVEFDIIKGLKKWDQYMMKS